MLTFGELRCEFLVLLGELLEFALVGRLDLIEFRGLLLHVLIVAVLFLDTGDAFDDDLVDLGLRVLTRTRLIFLRFVFRPGACRLVVRLHDAADRVEACDGHGSSKMRVCLPMMRSS
nr:hypothetical protein [Bifidobacterium pseudolongum]